MLRKLMLIINPYSGRGLSKFALGTIVSQLCNGGFTVTVCYAGEYNPEEIAYTHAGQYDLIVCVGGDGTLNAVVSGVMRSGLSIPIGYIPSGTANDVATTLELSREPNTAAQTIINGIRRPLDIGLFGDRYFTYTAAFGAFTGVAYLTPQSTKRALGHFAYILGGLSSVASIKAVRTIVEYEGGCIEGEFVFGCVLNSTSIAGFLKLDPKQVDLADGVFEVILVKHPIHLSDFFDILSSIVTKSYDGDSIQLFHTSKIRFSFDEELPWTVDGEYGGTHKEIGISNCHKAISIIVDNPEEAT